MVAVSVRADDVLHVERVDVQRVELLEEPIAIPRVARVHEDRTDVAPSDQCDSALDGLAHAEGALELRASHARGYLVFRVMRRVHVLQVEVLRVVTHAQHVNGVQWAGDVVQRDVRRRYLGGSPTSAPLELLRNRRLFRVNQIFVSRINIHLILLYIAKNNIKNAS